MEWIQITINLITYFTDRKCSFPLVVFVHKDLRIFTHARDQLKFVYFVTCLTQWLLHKHNCYILEKNILFFLVYNTKCLASIWKSMMRFMLFLLNFNAVFREPNILKCCLGNISLMLLFWRWCCMTSLFILMQFTASLNARHIKRHKEFLLCKCITSQQAKALFSHQKMIQPDFQFFRVITDLGLGMFSTCPWDRHENIKDVFQLPWQSQMSEIPQWDKIITLIFSAAPGHEWLSPRGAEPNKLN